MLHSPTSNSWSLMESLLLDLFTGCFLPSFLLLFLSCWFISLLLHSSTELLCRVSGLLWFTFQWKKQEMTAQCWDWGWGQPALKAWEKPATTLQEEQSLDRRVVFLEGAMGPGRLTDFTLGIDRRQSPPFPRRSVHKIPEERKSMESKSPQRSSLTVCSKSDSRWIVWPEKFSALNLICFILPVSHR